MCQLNKSFGLKTCLMFMILGFFNPIRIQAQQLMIAQEGVEIRAILSSKALNHIAVQNDRIVSVKGLQGEFELDKDIELGQVFIKPMARTSSEPIHIFLSTESGRTYALALLSQDIGAQSIVLKSAELSLGAFEQAGSYEASVKRLIQAMHKQTELEGFVVEKLNLKLPSVQGTTVVVLQAYTGHPFTAEILEIHNVTKNEVALDELDFYGDSVRALTILHKRLPPNAKTRVYRVRA